MKTITLPPPVICSLREFLVPFARCGLLWGAITGVVGGVDACVLSMTLRETIAIVAVTFVAGFLTSFVAVSSVAIHELGHTLGGLFFGFRLNSIMIGMGPHVRLPWISVPVYVGLPGGGYAHFEQRMYASPGWRRSVVALAGPFLNLAAASVGLWFVVFGGFTNVAYLLAWGFLLLNLVYCLLSISSDVAVAFSSDEVIVEMRSA